MKVIDSAGWASWVTNNQDPYGSACVRYAQAWAELMEARIAQGETVEQCARITSHAADVEGITGFMYGAAVSMLSQCWEYGEALRRWHNLEYQLRDEGTRASENGTVLNPALLRVDVG